jgi:hypothetical protein
VLLVALLGLDAFAADIAKATKDAEGRRLTAESGVRAIRAKPPAPANELSALYDATADAHNEWLSATDAAIKQGTTTEALNTTAGKAAATLVQWVAARNRALGETVLAGAVAATAETRIRQDLLSITTETVNRARGQNEKRRTQAVATLDARLRWKPWADLQ